MRLYNTYLLKNLAGPTFFITLSLTCVAWLTQSLRFIDMIVNQGLPVSTFLYFVMLLLPSLLGMVLPIALFVASIYVYNKLLYESELLVLKAAGISLVGLIKPLMILAIFITLIGYLISLFLLPASYREFKDLQYYLRDNYASTLLREGVFNNPTKGLTVYVKEREDNGTLKGILVHDNSNPEKPVTMMAKTGRIESGEDGVRFLMKDASRQQINRESGEVNILYFDSYPVDISFYTGDDLTRIRKKDERYLHELFWPEDAVQGKRRTKMIAEGHERLSWPLYSIVLPLLVLSIMLSGDFNRRGQSKQIVTAIAASIIFVLIGLGIKNLAAGGSKVGIVMMYVPSFIVIFLSVKMLITGKLLWSKKAPKQIEEATI